MTELIETRDEDFDWMLGGPPSRLGLVLPPGGVDDPETLAMVRAIHAAACAAGRPGAWMMVDGGEIVGLCGAVRPRGEAGEMEIGYGVAPEHRGQGHATRAVAAMVAIAGGDPALRTVTAVTAVGNIASQRVLSRNGFVEWGREVREEDGAVLLWKLPVR